jgi:hypothetical protein
MTRDTGAGMKAVAAIILFCLLLFIVSLFVVWIGDTRVHPPIDSASYPKSRAQ